MIDSIICIPVWMSATGCSSYGGASVMKDTCGSVLFVQSVKNCAIGWLSSLSGPPVAQFSNSARME
jgi:hypothetical protein